MPFVRSRTTLSLPAIIAARSTSTPPGARMPRFAKPSRACSNRCVLCSSSFEGMQPTFRQVPPSVARFSTQAVRMPSCAARIAAT